MTMKKLMIALGVIAITAVTQAASVKWNSGMLKAASNAEGVSGSATASSYTAYLYTFATLDANNTASGTSVDKLYASYIGKQTPVAQATANGMGVANITQTGLDNGSNDNPITVYGMVIYVDTATADSYDGVDAFVKVGFETGTYKDTTGLQFSNMGTQQANWTAVPEPTSGLLMLLGMAGLALRRRRA